MIWTRRAIVTDIEGTTRELLTEHMQFGSLNAQLTDSPGLEDFNEEIQFIQQIINQSDILIFVVDTRREISIQDEEIQQLIIRAGKKDRTILAVNKCDGQYAIKTQEQMISNRYSLGFDKNIGMSAQHDEGFFELQQDLVDIAQKNNLIWEWDKEDTWDIPIAIIWRPNSGKSTLINKLVWEEIAHVKDEAGTTLDYITWRFNHNGRGYTVFDTAGIRKKGKIVWLEKVALSKTMSLLDHTRPIVLYILDIVEWLTHRDLTLIGEIANKGLPVVVLINKIDLLEPKEVDLKVQALDIIKLFPWISIHRISAQDGIGIPPALKKVASIRENLHYRVPTPLLNKVLQKARLTRPPRFPNNNICKRKYITQVETFPPTFSLNVNNKEYANFSFQRWIEKVLRKEYGFDSIPMKLRFVSKVEDNPYLRINQGK